MPDETPQQVLDQLAAIGLTPQDDEDLDEITHRINAIRQALANLEPQGIDSLEPFNAPRLDEVRP
jgi:hypothetical protein